MEGGREGGGDRVTREVAGGKNDDVHQMRDRSTITHTVITEHPECRQDELLINI